ncbi:biotin carboxyl carrier protein of acetyl-CoA carboxylase [Streptococcus varani]|uniref:Biotin carboxyl carrier protein of acetyl-CoA carboxylase n=1 Tax=Streptococcus varani TaxID=1608583 RepID=A0A0E3WET9_9STRE|nr:acetyl-CoA carboxylase biotin carboxyl carrier protein [Streptococcus varani]CQR24286.1 biotin carboxyl carrier protein of acetyl-CoA carboxylase [Streptococcus varani]
MEVTAIKDLMSQFDASSLREFSYKNGSEDLVFSKNESSALATIESASVAAPAVSATPTIAVAAAEEVAPVAAQATGQAEGEEVASPLVGVAYLSPGPDKSAFVSVGDSVKKGQTLMIIEAMKVMNEIPAPHDGMVTEILVANEDVVEFGQGLVRIK